MSEINLQKMYTFPREALWEQLTKPELLSKWCIPVTDFTLEKGREFTLRSEPNRFWDGVFLCKVSDFKEHTYLSYKCRSQSMGLDSTVEWTIEVSGENATLKLRHSGFVGLKGLFNKMLLKTGWKQMLEKHLPAELSKQ